MNFLASCKVNTAFIRVDEPCSISAPLTFCAHSAIAQSSCESICFFGGSTYTNNMGGHQLSMAHLTAIAMSHL